ncbi:hypothetical protein RB594_002339 [Gaeumannomyces avenae]
MAARGTTEPQAASARPGVGDILLVIHDFQARSSDELSLTKGDRVELIERDDEFGDGWFLGKHLVSGNSGLFPEVYTRPAPRGAPNAPPMTSPKPPANLFKPVPTPPTESSRPDPSPTTPATAADVPKTITTAPTPKATSSPSIAPKPVSTPSLSFGSLKGPSPTSSSPAIPTFSNSNKSLPSLASSGMKPETPRMASGQTDSYVLNETLNVIDEHITETLRSTPNNGHNDSGSEYSSHLDHRMSYIQGEETDEEEENMHTRPEVQAWSADDVAEYLFTAGVEKHHCEVFRDQEITGEVLLEMDQTSIFIKAFDLGSVGRRLKTWQKIKALQDEVNGLGARRTTHTHGSDVGSMDGGRGSRSRSRTNTLTSTGPPRLPAIDSHSASLVQGSKRRSVTQTQFEPVSPVSPVSPSSSRPHHEQRPSAASVRDLHHSRRHSSSTDFRITGTTIHTPTATPRLPLGGTLPQPDAVTSHRKQPSFDRNWTLGSATSASNSGAHTTGPRPLSSAGFPQDFLAVSNDKDSLDLDRGYFSSTDVDGRKRNVLKKRDSVTAHSRTGSKGNSYADEQRVRSATALTRHSRAFGSIDSTRDQPVSPAAQKYYGMAATPHRRTASTNTTDSSIRPTLPLKDAPPPTVTKLDGNTPRDGARASPVTPNSPAVAPKQGIHVDWLSKPGLKNGGFGLRAISDAVTGHERSKIASPIDSPSKDSPIHSPARTGSSTPSVGPSFDLDSPSAKSPSTTTTAPPARMPKRKGKKDTSAYLKGLAKVTPREAMAGADYSGWMKKKSSNLMTTWKPRLFVLKGRRLAYYYSEDDDQEKGLIDISFHRVLPADNERLTGLHATLTGASTTPTIPAGSQMQTLAATDAERDVTEEADTIFIFKLVPPRAGLSRAVNFTKPMVHYFAVPNVKQGRLWMAALMKATIDRDDMQPITTTYQQKTISLSKAQKMRHRPPALMNLDEKLSEVGSMMSTGTGEGDDESSTKNGVTKDPDAIGGGLGIVFDENDSGVSGLEKLGLQKVESARSRQFPFEAKESSMPQSA